MDTENFQIAPSILAADFNILGAQIAELEKNGIEMLHIDVMDGMFVPSISFGFPVISSIRKECRMFFDVHLMIERPERYVKEFVISGADSITVHAEACEDLNQTIDLIHDSGVKCGIALNPETEIERVLPYLEKTDMILVMSVRPGFGGQRFREETLKKAEFLRDLRSEEKHHFFIEMDGGINKRTKEMAINSGVDILVAGTAVFSGDISENVRIMGGSTYAFRKHSFR
ncbi:MAG: ribulose-phosphate 3-epimerase [Lachnospiraceae bacterium]|nr:ribulose-phosphate 3-epimerase [Lachnospiraceae bacterium]